MNGIDRIQDLISRLSGLELALEKAWLRLAELNPDVARREIESLRDDAIEKFKNSDVPAELEMRHAEINRPAIEVIELLSDRVLRQINK